MRIESNKLAAFLYYLKERENIRLRKEEGHPWPWTGDKILQEYSFTNVKRAHDRTTRELVAHYERGYFKAKGDADAQLLYNCAIGRYFGTSEFALRVGWMKKHDAKKLTSTAKAMMRAGEKVFTGAYIITSAGQAGPKYRVVAHYLGGLWQARNYVLEQLRGERTWEGAYRVMAKLPGFGGSGFMSKEVLQDYLLVTRSKPIYDEETWTPMGPGGRRGMNRLLGRRKDWRAPEERFILEVQDLHKMVKGWWKDTFPDAEPLTAHDVQFCLCEFDKYERVRLKQGKPKQKYWNAAFADRLGRRKGTTENR